MTDMQRVVVTGLGCISALGNTVKDFWENLFWSYFHGAVIPGACHLRPKGLLDLLPALQSGRQPGLEQRLRLEGGDVRHKAPLHLGHQGLLHGRNIGQAEEGARLGRRAVYVDFDLHARGLLVLPISRSARADW